MRRGVRIAATHRDDEDRRIGVPMRRSRVDIAAWRPRCGGGMASRRLSDSKRVQKDRQKAENVTGIADRAALYLLQIRSLLTRSF
jgi:hypothetical protein